MKTASDIRAHYHVWVGPAKTSDALLDPSPACSYCNAIKYDGHVDHHNELMMIIMIIPAKVLHVTDLMKPIALDLHLCPCAIVQALVQTLELMEK